MLSRTTILTGRKIIVFPTSVLDTTSKNYNFRQSSEYLHVNASKLAIFANIKRRKPLASEVLICHLQQSNCPPWTSYFVKYRSIINDQRGLSHFNSEVRDVNNECHNYHILRTGCYPYIKYHCTKRPVEDLSIEDGFFRVIKVINLGIPCLAYGLAAIYLIKHVESVNTPHGPEMWTIFSRLFNYPFGMIYGLAHRAVHFLGRMRRFQLPWTLGNSDTFPAPPPSTISKQNESSPTIPNTSNVHSESSPSVSNSTNGFFPRASPKNEFVMECETKTSKTKTYACKKEKLLPECNSKSTYKRKALEGEAGSTTKKSKGKKAQTVLKTSASDEHPRPNHFIAIQVSNPEILSKVSDLQEKMLSKEVTSKVVNKFSNTAHIFHDTMVRKEKLHFTLHVFHLKNDNLDKEKAKSALENCFVKCKSEFENKPLRLNIEGLGHFRHGVIFGKIQGSEEISRLEALSLALRTEFESVNIPGDPKPFRPHMTIAKLSKSKTLARKVS